MRVFRPFLSFLPAVFSKPVDYDHLGAGFKRPIGKGFRALVVKFVLAYALGLAEMRNKFMLVSLPATL